MQPRFSERGSAMPLIAICLLVFMGSGAMAVDVGELKYQQRQQQSATDAAALGGAQQLAVTGCGNSSAATTAADNDATDNGFVNGAKATVYVQNPPASGGPYGGNTCAVEVQITQNYATWFLRLFGYQTGMAETTQAIASANSSGNGCIYLLSPTVTSIFNGDTVNSPHCGILINDTATFNGDPTFDTNYIGYAGAAPIENGTTFTQATPAPMLPVADPCPEISGCASLTNNPPASTGCSSPTYNGTPTVNLQPGCFSSIIVNGCTTVNFAPGTYVFTGTTIINGETNVTGSGVTLYVTASGTPPTFNGIPNVSLSPPTSGSDEGVLYYQVPANTQNPIFNGTSQNLSGLIYAPGATHATFNGTGGGYLVMVLGAATFNGSSAYDFATPPPDQALIKQAVLGE
ncbi:MAG: Tad domain-containing protein [Candidatus Cybelea sp.]